MGIYTLGMSFLPNLQAHAIGDTPEWELIDQDARNIWQEVAAKTGGYGAPAMWLTYGGTGLDIAANVLLSQGNVREGTLSARTLLIATLALATEGLLDIGDGIIATATGTRSPLGRGADAVSDAFRISLTAATLTCAGILPKSAVAILAAEKAATAVPSVIAKLRGNMAVVASEGKITSSLQRMTLGGFLSAATFDQLATESTVQNRITSYTTSAEILRKAAWTSLASSALLTIPTSYKYISAAKSAK